MCTHILVVTLLRSNTYFDAIIALKIGNRLAIIKIVKTSSMGLCCLIFSYIYIYIYIYIYLERGKSLLDFGDLDLIFKVTIL